MTEQTNAPLSEICAQFQELRLPRWNDLPDLELYMDQVLALIGRYLGAYPGFDERGLTASMVNNYVKMGALPAPHKKRYSRCHLARLMVICVLKSSLPIAAVCKLTEHMLSADSEEAFYNGFCDQFEAAAGASVTALQPAADEDAIRSVLRAALRAQAEQALARRLYACFFPEKT